MPSTRSVIHLPSTQLGGDALRDLYIALKYGLLVGSKIIKV